MLTILAFAVTLAEGLRADAMTDPERQARFVHEARAVSALKHPNIVTVHDLGTEADFAYMVMELVEGRSLDQGDSARWSFATKKDGPNGLWRIPTAGGAEQRLLPIGLGFCYTVAPQGVHSVTPPTLPPQADFGQPSRSCERPDHRGRAPGQNP